MKTRVASIFSVLIFAFAVACTFSSGSLQETPSSAAHPQPASAFLPVSSSTWMAEASDSAAASLLFKDETNWQPPHPKALICGWHGDDIVGAGLSDRYLFLEDGTFYFAANEMTQGVRLRYCDGDWCYADGILQLTLKRKIVVEGGDFVEGYEARPAINSIAGGEYVKYVLQPSEYEVKELPLEIIDIEEDQFSHIAGGILLAGQPFWALGGAGYSDMQTLWDDYDNCASA